MCFVVGFAVVVDFAGGCDGRFPAGREGRLLLLRWWLLGGRAAGDVAVRVDFIGGRTRVVGLPGGFLRAVEGVLDWFGGCGRGDCACRG